MMLPVRNNKPVRLYPLWILCFSLLLTSCDQGSEPSNGSEHKTDQSQPTKSQNHSTPTGIDRWVSFRHHGGHNALLDKSILRLGPNNLKSWDLTDGYNIKWKSEITLPGLSSPVIYGNHIYVSAATDQKRLVEAFDLKTGKKKWTFNASKLSSHVPENIFKDDVGYAAATPCVNKNGVYTIFTNGDVISLTHQGKIKWHKSMGLPPIDYGYASSPVVASGTLIIQWDHEGEVAKNPPHTQLASGLVALSTTDGAIRWHVKRDWGPSWTSPVLSPDRKSVITTAGEFMTAHDITSGNEIWRAGGLVGELAPSPIATDKLAIGFSPDSEIWAYHMGGSGDITKTHHKWIGEDFAPNIASSAFNGDTLVSLHSTGHLTGINVTDGSLRFHEKVKETFTASPVIIQNRIYISSEEGNTHIYEMTDDGIKKIGQANNQRAVKATMIPTSEGLIFRTVGMPGLLFMVSHQDI